MTGADRAREIKAAMEGRIADLQPSTPGPELAAAQELSFEPEPEPAYLFRRKLNTGAGSTIEVIVWEDRPEFVDVYDINGEPLEAFSRDAAHELGLALADALHRRS